MKTKSVRVVHNGRMVGVIEGNTFTKSVERRIHFFRKLQGYAIDKAVISRLPQKGVRFVVVKEKDTGDTYRVPLAEYLEHGIPLNHGFGEQIVLPLSYFERQESRQLSLL